MQARFALGSVGMRGRRDAALGGLITTERRQMPGPPGSAGLRQTGRHDEVSGGRRTRLDPRRRPRPDLRSMGFRQKSRHWSHEAEAGAWIQAESRGGDGRDCRRWSARNGRVF